MWCVCVWFVCVCVCACHRWLLFFPLSPLLLRVFKNVEEQFTLHFYACSVARKTYIHKPKKRRQTEPTANKPVWQHSPSLHLLAIPLSLSFSHFASLVQPDIFTIRHNEAAMMFHVSKSRIKKERKGEIRGRGVHNSR